MHSKQQRAPSRDLLKTMEVMLLSFLAILLHLLSQLLAFCLFVCFCVVLFVGFFDHMACIPPREGVWLSSKMKMISSYNSEPSGSWDYFSRLIHSRSCGIIASDIISPKPIANAHVWFINFFNVLQLHWSVSKSLGLSNHSSRSCLQKQLHSEQSGGVTELHQ